MSTKRTFWLILVNNTVTIKEALAAAQSQLKGWSETAYLDAEVLVMQALRVTRSYLYAYGEQVISGEAYQQLQTLLACRKRAEPIAYLTGYQEFWSMNLAVTPDTLIPRPETELLVQKTLERLEGEKKCVADLGTGSGAVALAIAKERPFWTIYATDQWQQALAVAENNAKRLMITNVTFHVGDWLQALPPIQFDAIISNPPYIDEDDPCLTQASLNYEPRHALVAAENGLAALATIINAAPYWLRPGGCLLLEHGFAQGDFVQNLFSRAGYKAIQRDKDLAGHDRVTSGVWDRG